jgi:hypothetical protein
VVYVIGLIDSRLLGFCYCCFVALFLFVVGCFDFVVVVMIYGIVFCFVYVVLFFFFCCVLL